MNDEFKFQDGKWYKLVFCIYRTVNGKRIYPKKSKYFRFWVEADKVA